KVMFVSLADNLVEGDTNHVADLFVKDLLTGAIERVDTTADGLEAQGALSGFGADAFSVSADGTKVVFSADFTDLVPDTGGITNVFLKDLVTGDITCLSVDGAGLPSGGDIPVLSPDGQKVAFIDGNNNLVLRTVQTIPGG